MNSAWRNEFAELVRAKHGVETPVSLEQPRQSSFGELAVPVAFQLARQLKQAPRAIADTLVREVGAIAGVSAFEIAGNGYINVRLQRGVYGRGALEYRAGAHAGTNTKVIVEHTNINPNKAAHIGHLRNAVLGDTFVRMLRATGETVEVQNYIDNTGVQVADVVAGFEHLEKLNVGAGERPDRESAAAVRLPLLGSVRAHVAIFQGQSRRAGLAARYAARD